MGKSKRIVIELDDVDLKRRLHAALADEGRNLKDWFTLSAMQYLKYREAYGLLAFSVPPAAEGATTYSVAPPPDNRRT